MRLRFLLLLAIVTLAVACGSSTSSEPAPESGTPGAKVRFNLNADWSTPEAFFDFPYPSDLRLEADGSPDVAGFPNPKNLEFVENLRRVADDRPAFPTVPVAYFRFDAKLPDLDLEAAIPAEPGSPVLLVDIDPDSPERGKLYPTVASDIDPDIYVPEGLLGVAARPGFILAPERTYAFVVRRSMGDADGKLLGVPPTLVRLAQAKNPGGTRGKAALELYAPLWETLAQIGVDPADVAAATVFTTGDVVKKLGELSDKVLNAYDVQIENLHVDPDDGASHPDYCELLGTVSYPQFQRGVVPFDTEGLFDIGSDGLPTLQRHESAPVVITLPKQPMPAGGYPLVLYFHGSGGLASSVVDRGTWHPETDPSKCPEKSLEDWEGVTGCNTQGEGPAFVLSPHGFAMAGSALPVNPERFPGAGEQEYLNFNNLAAFRDTFGQGVIEQRLFLKALSKLEIPADVVASCDGLSLPPGATSYRIADVPVFGQGQSMGGMYTNMIGAVEPRLEGLVPTGAGGYWSYFILKTHLIEGVEGQIAVVLSIPTTKITFMHPALVLFQTAVEAADPIVFMPRLARDPLPGHPARSIYEPIGKGDSYFPTVVYDAIALAYGHPQAGDVVWPSMQDALSLASLDGLVSYPIANNLQSLDGRSYTGVAVQHEGDGVYDPHALYSQVDDVKYQYGCFLRSLRDTGTATVFAPAPLGSPCGP